MKTTVIAASTNGSKLRTAVFHEPVASRLSYRKYTSAAPYAVQTNAPNASRTSALHTSIEVRDSPMPSQ